MPTRIVLKESAPPSRLGGGGKASPGLTEEEERTIRFNSVAAAEAPTSPLGSPSRARRASSFRASSGGQRKVVGFRSSILREFSSKSNLDASTYEDDFADEAAQQRRMELTLSNEDIRASPRLLGYLFGGIASVVMLVSVVQFYLREEENFNQLQEIGEIGESDALFPSDQFFHTSFGSVYIWKLWCCVAVASSGTLGFLVILLMHFDVFFFQKTWFQFFRDGSLAERNLLLGLTFFWAAALHVNTSAFSVGEVQANVFFTTWIVFVCMVLNLGVWRESAGLPRLAVKVLLHHRETTYNWCWTLLFSLITAGAATDMYFNRDKIALRLDGDALNLSWGDWMRTLGLLWAECLLCVVSIACNHLWSNACKLNLGGGCRFVLNWRFLEGIIILCMVGFKFWIILEYTGVEGVINGLNNVYFGIWGSFFNIVFTFGTWLRENRDIDYII